MSRLNKIDSVVSVSVLTCFLNQRDLLVARNREPEACKRTVGQMVEVVRIVLWSILNIFFKIYLLSFGFVSLSWARLVWNLSTRVFSHFWSFKRFSYLTLCLDCESVTFHFFYIRILPLPYADKSLYGWSSLEGQC